MTVRGTSSPSQSRLEALRHKHAILKSRIEEEQRRPSAAEFYLRQLKKQKLLIKEQIEGVRSGTAHKTAGNGRFSFCRRIFVVLFMKNNYSPGHGEYLKSDRNL